MGPTRVISNALTSSARPIGLTDFVNALSQAFGNKTSRYVAPRNTIGLAISGGGDSMALATLCSQLQKSSHKLELSIGSGNNGKREPIANLGFQAFIVDHCIRSGSDIEAEAVARVLEQHGIRADVLKLDWHGLDKPADMPNFESLARKLRFQALGKACKARAITSLLLAHHQDDQAETILMRLITGHGKMGLKGIKRSANIPECHGIHGVHESGGIDLQDEATGAKFYLSRGSVATGPGASSPRAIQSKCLTEESGGIMVYRPLLQYTKARLIATCRADGIEWFEDHTNSDPTLTPRNAVRHMYNSHALPPSLCKPTLLALSEKFNKDANEKLKLIDTLLANSRIQLFNNRSGILKIQFPKEWWTSITSSPFRHNNSKEVVAGLLCRFINLVSPEKYVHLSSLKSAIKHFFPSNGSFDTDSSTQSRFTAAGVLFDPLQTKDSPLNLGRDRPRSHEWLLSRQPYKSSIEKPRINFPASSRDLDAQNWSPWKLFDGRYWIRVQHLRHDRPIFIRPFEQKDMPKFRSEIQGKDEGIFPEMLKLIAPKEVRWTLPAIVIDNSRREERVIALPTLNIRAWDADRLVSWEVRYKKIDVETLDRALKA